MDRQMNKLEGKRKHKMSSGEELEFIRPSELARTLPCRLLLLLVLAGAQQGSVECFWLADTSLFQPIVGAAKSVELQQESSLAPVGGQANASSAPTELVGPQWSQVDLAGQEGAQTGASQLQPAQPSAGCQCEPDWLRNQTAVWLSKWMAAPSTAAQLRSLVSWSNSTVPKRLPGNSHQHPNQQQQRSQQQRGNHWSRSTRSGASNANNANKPAKQHQLQQPRQPPAERGPQGPKGDTGARGPKGDRGERGEMGPAGQAAISSVRDRDSLFELLDGQPAQTTQTASANKQARPAQLVYVEDEQLLVLATSQGYRPIPLLAPLRDFRKTIQRFSLTAGERRKLLAAAASPSVGRDNSISQANAPATAQAESLDNELDLVGESVDDDDDDDDDDDEEDEEDDEDVEADEQIRADADDDDDREDADGGAANGVKQGGEHGRDRGGLDKRAHLAGNKDGRLDVDNSIGNDRRVGPKMAAKRPSSALQARSAAAAALVSASIDNSITTGGPVGQQAHQLPNSSGLRLRLAALNEPFSGNLHGIRGADFECRRNAARANVKGSFRAFLASGFQSLHELVRLNVHKYPIVNLRGETLASSWHDLFRQPARVANPLSRIYSFDGRHVATDSNWPNKLVWHGATNRAGQKDSTDNCDGWHSDSLAKFGLATPIHSPRSAGRKRAHRKRHLAEQTRGPPAANSTNNDQLGFVLEQIERFPCRMPLVVLCVETIGQAAPSLDQGAKLARLSSDGASNDLESNSLTA